MHEMGTVVYIIDTVEQICREQNLTAVDSVTVQVGEVSAIIPEYIVDYFNWAKKKSEFLKDSSLIVETLPAVTFCEDCEKTYSTIEYGKECPYCHGGNTYLLCGNEYIIKEITAM